jgi:hypothetical protein
MSVTAYTAITNSPGIKLPAHALLPFYRMGKTCMLLSARISSYLCDAMPSSQLPLLVLSKSRPPLYCHMADPQHPSSPILLHSLKTIKNTGEAQSLHCFVDSHFLHSWAHPSWNERPSPFSLVASMVSRWRVVYSAISVTNFYCELNQFRL